MLEDTILHSLELCGDPLECRSVCIRHEQRYCIHINGGTLKFQADPDDSTGPSGY